MKMERGHWFCLAGVCGFLFFMGPTEVSGAGHPCYPEDSGLSYLLASKPFQKFQYLVRYETFFSTALGKEKGFFVILPEYLEVFGRLEPQKLPLNSSLDFKYVCENNPLTLLKQRGMSRLPHWLYFDYGTKEKFQGITKGNRNFEKALNEESHQIPVQPYNGKSGHHYLFWRSRTGIVLQHHSDVFRKTP